MTDPLTQQLSEASFRGVPFFVRTEDQPDGGRRLILHDYPLSDTRFVEDIGEIPPRFGVSAFVTGRDFLNRSRELEQALNTPGPAQLVLPTFGVYTAYAEAYKRGADQKAIGEITFELTFVLGRPQPGPSQAERDLEDVYENGDAARLAIQTEFALSWEPPSIAPNISTAIFDLGQATASIVEGFSTILASGALSDVQKGAANVALGASSLVRNGANLAQTFVAGTVNSPGLWQAVSLGLSNVGDGLETALRLTRFGSDLTLQISSVNRASSAFDRVAASSLLNQNVAVPLWPATTATRIQRNRNRQRIVRTQRLNGMVLAYEQLAAREYRTQNDIQQARDAVETAYRQIMQVETADRDIIQSDDLVREAIEEVRLSALEVLDQKRQQAYGLATVRLGIGTSSALAAYALYAEELRNGGDLTTRSLDIRSLNPNDPADALTGDTTVLQQA